MKDNKTKEEVKIGIDYLIYYLDEQLVDEIEYHDCDCEDECECGHDHECHCHDDDVINF